MQLRSGRRLVLYPPPEQQGGVHHRRSQQSSEDRISGLPEDLLIEILIRLRSVADAASTGAVSHAWRGFWTELPELRFFSAHPLSVKSTLARITRPSLDLLDINWWACWMDEDWGGDVSLLLRSAALLLPEKLIICVLASEDYPVELPCFERTSCLSLHLMGSLPITLPQSGEFTVLKSLHLQSCCIDLGALLPLCPCLRILNMLNVRDPRHVDMVIVHSPSLEEFDLEIKDHDICRIEIVAPMLKEVTVNVDIAKGFSLSFLAPMVKKLRWDCSCLFSFVGFGQIWRLLRINERELDELHVVTLDAEWSVTQLIAHLPVTVFSVLELDLEIKGHTFGPMMLCLLQIQPTMQGLKVILARDEVIIRLLILYLRILVGH